MKDERKGRLPKLVMVWSPVLSLILWDLLGPPQSFPNQPAANVVELSSKGCDWCLLPH